MQVMILTGHMQEGPHNLHCYVPLIEGPMKWSLLSYKWLDEYLLCFTCCLLLDQVWLTTPTVVSVMQDKQPQSG